MEEGKNTLPGRKPGVYKKQDFESYLKWRSLPSSLRGQPKAVLEKLGFDDIEILTLLEIRTQTEFALKYGIKDLGTLSDWNKRIEKEGLIEGIYAWARVHTPDVVFALRKKIIKNGNGHDVKTWFDIVENI